MIRALVPFKHWHYQWLEDVAEPGGLCVPDTDTLMQMQANNSWTGMIDGDVVFCAGTVAMCPTRHVAWAVLHSTRSKKHMVWITRIVRNNLDGVRGRIELTARVDFPPAQKWARVLGFHVETPLMKSYGPEGEDHIGYVRIN